MQTPAWSSRPGQAGRWLLAIAVAGVVVPRPAHAYLDPISGSVLLQVLVAGVLASVFGVKRFFADLAAKFRRRPGPPST